MSAATKAGTADESAITSTSEGPAGMSMAVVWLTICLAFVTKRLPGPKILSTRRMLSVP